MASGHLLTKYITWRKSCLRSSESWNRCTCASCKWLPFLIGQVCSQVWCSPYLAANFGFFVLRTFPWSPSKVEVGTFYPLHTQSRFQVHLHYTWSSSVKLTYISRSTKQELVKPFIGFLEDLEFKTSVYFCHVLWKLEPQWKLDSFGTEMFLLLKDWQATDQSGISVSLKR